MSDEKRSVDWLMRAVVFVVVLFSGSTLLYTIFLSNDAPFIRRAGGAPWIGVPLATTTNLIAFDPQNLPAYTFVKRFDADGAAREDPGGARLTGGALREATIVLNGQKILEAPAGDWRRGFDTYLETGVRAGRNELRVTVSNAQGPALLQLRLEHGGQVLETDASWQVIGPRSNPVAAVIARDRVAFAESRLLPEPGQILGERYGLVLLMFACCAGAYAFGASRLSPHACARIPAATLAIVTTLWLTLFAFKFTAIPVMVGFDAQAHLVYIDAIREQRSLPLASEGFSSYHPPTFHLLTGLLVALFDVTRESAGGRVVYRLLAFAAGLANIWLTYFAARKLWPQSALRISLATAFAGLLPMNIYMSAYVSNEPLHSALVSGALLLAIHLLQAERTRSRTLVGLSATLGVALLTKFTSLVIAPVLIFFVACKIWLIENQRFGRALGVGIALGGGAALIAGWFYVRNWLVFGDPFVWNRDMPGQYSWWMQPGFHTIAYYTSFGESLRHPFFAGFQSFWDGVYSTTWGDGLAGGMVRLATRHGQWNYDFMTLGYWMAFPATILIIVGFARFVRESLHEESRRQRLANTMICIVLFILSFSLLLITLRIPYYAQARAVYILSGVLPLSLVASVGLAWTPERLAAQEQLPMRAAYFGWLGALACVILAAFLG